MPAALPIRADRGPAELRALANALDGRPREAARLAAMTGQTRRDWVHRSDEAGVAGPAPWTRASRRR